MTNEQILEKQVEALEKLLQLRSAIIEDLEAKVSSLQSEVAKHSYNPYPGVINTPWIGHPQWAPANPVIYPGGGSSGTITISTTCPDGSPHEYPSMWGGINTPSCKKCGQGSITSVTTSGYIAPVHTTGFAQNLGQNQSDVAGQQNTAFNNVLTLTNIAK